MPSFVPAYVFPSQDGAPDPRSEEILEAAAQFLWSDEMAESLDSFSANHASMFAGATADGEQKLEWHQAHLDFQRLFEFQLEKFIAEQEFSQAEFEAACEVCILCSSQHARAPVHLCSLTFTADQSNRRCAVWH